MILEPSIKLARYHFLVFLRDFKNILKMPVNEKVIDLQPRGKFRCLLLTASSLSGLSFLLMFNKSLLSWISDWFRWCPTSTAHLEDAETKMLSYIKTHCEVSYVPVNTSADGDECKVRSLIVNKNSEDKATPLVLLHGFASGIGLWVLNIDSLSKDRPLYALDILGFGSSSRPSFSKDAEMAENQLVESIEEWRKKVGLNHFILLGHSMGGFLAASYAIKFPERVKHLVLADPWGFPVPDLSQKRIDIPIWAKTLATLLRPFNPLASLRAAGPWGPKLVQRMRPDILRKFESVVSDTSDVSNYIYHCNAQYPSGEAAFKAMTAQFGWANRPMILRISQIRQDIPITFIYGSRSWIDSCSGEQTTALRGNSYVKIKMIDGAGHHVYADKADIFNDIVSEICRKAEKYQPTLLSSTTRQDTRKTSLNLSTSDETCIAESV